MPENLWLNFLIKENATFTWRLIYNRVRPGFYWHILFNPLMINDPSKEKKKQEEKK